MEGATSTPASVSFSTWRARFCGSASVPVTEDSLVSAKQQLAEAVEGLVDVLRTPDVVRSIGEVDRANLAKYLMITKLRLENAIAMVRSGEAD